MPGGQRLIDQLVRYGLVGLVAAASDFAAYAAVLWLSDEAYLAANCLGKAIGAGVGFVLHRKITFTWRQRDLARRQLGAYLAVFAFNLALSSALLWALVGRLELDAYWSKLAVDALVIALAFVLSRTWVYRAA